MRSLRSWLVGLALGAALALFSPSAKGHAQGMPRGITYQGLLEQSGVPFNGIVQMDLYFASPADPTNVMYHQVAANLQVTNGIFNMVLGPFPESMKFDEQYSMTIVVSQGSTTVTLPAQLMWSAPYALNAERVQGLDVSTVPVNGDLFPIPLEADGKISSSILPQITNGQLQSTFIQTMNGIGPDASDNIEIDAGAGIMVTPGSHSITISSAQLSPNFGVQTLTAMNGSNTSAAIVALDSETNGNAALMVQGGIGANNPSRTADGSGLYSGSPQTYWADEVSVPAATTSSLQVYNKLVGPSSTIIVTPVGIAAFSGAITVTSQSAGTFTVSSNATIGTSAGGVVTALNYLVINH